MKSFLDKMFPSQVDALAPMIYREREMYHEACTQIAELEAEKASLLAALRTLVNNIPIPEIELARSAWGNTNVACVLDARAKAVEAIADVEEGKK